MTKKRRTRKVNRSSITGRFIQSSMAKRHPGTSSYKISGFTMPTNRKVHITSPSSATEIRRTLGVSNDDLLAALEALGD